MSCPWAPCSSSVSLTYLAQIDCYGITDALELTEDAPNVESPVTELFKAEPVVIQQLVVAVVGVQANLGKADGRNWREPHQGPPTLLFGKAFANLGVFDVPVVQ